jgi:hypothetical protein
MMGQMPGWWDGVRRRFRWGVRQGRRVSRREGSPLGGAATLALLASFLWLLGVLAPRIDPAHVAERAAARNLAQTAA